MRARLLAQLNQVLQTRDTARGLIVSMPDVLFDFNKYTLKPEARERLARVSGIVLAYPDLKLQIEGYTDAIGSEEYNQTLSEKRAETVRDYLVSSGVSMNNVAAQGLGKADPVADNSTAAGRKLNRRVEMIVSGDVIGSQLTPGASGDTSPANPQ
jgi:outer membrane protein OmpA-like peptidoglycan-associated protein